MKKATKSAIANGKKLYMNLQGNTFTETQAREYYGERFESAILAKVVLDADGNVIGDWV